MSDQFIERRIVTGLITSTDFLEEISYTFKSKYLQSTTARTLAHWCFEYWERYKTAPGKEIESIFFHKTKNLEQATVEWIEDVLDSLAGEYSSEQFNLQHLLRETNQYFKQQALLGLSETVKDLVQQEELSEAESVVSGFNSPDTPTGTAISALDADPVRYKKAFTATGKSLITFPGDLGIFINEQLIQGAFIGITGQDKVGKSFFMLELAMRAIMQGSNVALFEVGDMTEEDMLCRIGVYLTQRSDMPGYCEEIHIPVLDCIQNQLGKCKKHVKNPSSIFAQEEFKDIQKKEYEEYIELLDREYGYKHCHYCSTYPEQQGILKFKGALWYTKRPPVQPLIWQDAVSAVEKFKKRYKRNLDLFIYPSGMLRPKDIKTELNILNKKKGYMPKVILVDYPDVMESDNPRLDVRGKTNQIWQAGRNISQEYHCLVIYTTQSDTAGYSKNASLLDRTNFSEDKRKNAHVTAMFGLNQTDNDRAKGILRLNKILVRKGRYDQRKVCHILQRLEIGRPFLGSFF